LLNGYCVKPRDFIARPARQRGGRLPWYSAMALLSLLAGGCATTGEQAQRPEVELTSRAVAPVGGTIPVFIERRCTANCGAVGFALSRAQVSALTESGNYVPTIPVEQAIKLAGGTQQLVDAMGVGESNSSTIARESGFEFQNTSQGIFAILAVPFAVAHAGSLASQSTETIQQIRIEQVSVPDCAGHAGAPNQCPSGANLYQLHHDPAIGYDRGWVFFPAGKYLQVKAPYEYYPYLFSREKFETEIIIAPWNGSSSRLATPRPASQPPGAPAPG
jgi:hypothetical protein